MAPIFCQNGHHHQRLSLEQLFWSQRCFYYFSLAFHRQRNKTCLLWLIDDFPFNEWTQWECALKGDQSSVGVPDWQIRASDSQWHSGRAPHSQSPGWQTALKSEPAHPESHQKTPWAVYRLRINIWDESLRVAQCLTCLKVAAIKNSNKVEYHMSWIRTAVSCESLSFLFTLQLVKKTFTAKLNSSQSRCHFYTVWGSYNDTWLQNHVYRWK